MCVYMRRVHVVLPPHQTLKCLLPFVVLDVDVLPPAHTYACSRSIQHLTASVPRLRPLLPLLLPVAVLPDNAESRLPVPRRYQSQHFVRYAPEFVKYPVPLAPECRPL